MATFFDTAGSDTIAGSAGNDQVYYTGGNDLVSLGGGDDVFTVQALSGNADHATVTGGDGIDAVIVGPGAVFAASTITIDLLAGTAAIGASTFALSGFEQVQLSYSHSVTNVSVSGNDDANFFRSANFDVFTGSYFFDGRGGNDTIVGSFTPDQIHGGDGNDLIFGEVGWNTITGDAGDDTIQGGSGGLGVGNLIDGGSGNDYIYGGGAPYQRSGGIAQPPPNASGSDTISGGDGNDHIFGHDGGSSQLIDASEPDVGDSIDAGNGDDYVWGNAGADTVHGGQGDDRLYGAADDDRLFGDAGNDHINGNLGNDVIDGGAGDDDLRGGKGDDQLFGGEGGDTLNGDMGNDTIHGGAGIDLLTGGDGADRFTFATSGVFSISDAAFTVTSANLTDAITDFTDGLDKLSFGFTPAVVLTGAAQTSFAAASTLATQLFSGHAGDHEVAAIQVGADTYLFYSASGGDGVDSAVRLDQVNSAVIDVTDFV